MSKLLRCKIDVTKIDKTLLFKGQKGTYMDFNLWINDEPDKFGNDCSIEQQVPRDAPKNYIGNGKWYKPKIEPVETEERPGNESDLPF